MGRTQRRRKKRLKCMEKHDMSKILNLQKALKLKSSNIQISHFNDFGWGIRCKKRIEKGDVLIALPLHHLITTEVSCDIFSVLKVYDQTPQLILSIFLIYESHLKEISKFYPYIESLPKSFTNPYFCTNDELKLLPEFIKNEVVAQTIFIDGIIKNLFEIIDYKFCTHCKDTLKNIFTREKCIWAWFILNTRSVYYEDRKHKSLALAPFLDLFNHSDDTGTKMFIDFKDRLYILKTTHHFKKYEQVFIKYGDHSNVKLFLEYGFILPKNLNDSVEFSFKEVVESVREIDVKFDTEDKCIAEEEMPEMSLTATPVNYLVPNGMLDSKIPLQRVKTSICRKITKSKFKLIESNKLNRNLTKNSEFSWNLIGLIYVLITTDQKSVLQSKIYSHSFAVNENILIQKISEIILEKKFTEWKRSLVKMAAVGNCTPSFQIAKNLIQSYLSL